MAKTVYIIQADDLLPLGGGLYLVEGTLLPAAADVKSGVAYGPGGSLTGELAAGEPDYPAEADVRDGTEFDDGAKTGTLDLPAVGDVRAGVKFDGETKTGTLAVKDPPGGIRMSSPEGVSTLSMQYPPFSGLLDLTDLTSLSYLDLAYCSYGQLTGLRVANEYCWYFSLYEAHLSPGVVDLSDMAGLQTLQWTSGSCGGIVFPSQNQLGYLLFQNVSTMMTPVVVQGCASLAQAVLSFGDYPALTVSGCTSLTILDASGVGMMAEVTLDGCPALNSVSLYDGALPQAEVDAVLVYLAAGSVEYGYVNLTGPSMGVPSATGLAAKATLEARSWTVMVNS